MQGFKFESQTTTPNEDYKFVQSYIIYFAVCLTIAISAWAIFLKCFNVLPKETIAEMRRESNQKGAGQKQESPKK